MKHSLNVTTLLLDRGFGKTSEEDVFRRGKHIVELKEDRKVEIREETVGVKSNVEYKVKILTFRGLVRNADILDTILNCCCYES